MNRIEGLQYIKDNSRLMNEGTVGNFKIEYRLMDNGRSFVLLDMGEYGWNLYYPSGEGLIKDLVKEFNGASKNKGAKESKSYKIGEPIYDTDLESFGTKVGIDIPSMPLLYTVWGGTIKGSAQNAKDLVDLLSKT